MLCDWLPPDFGAVGQYAVGFARELAGQGHAVTLVGFSSRGTDEQVEQVDAGTLRIRRLHVAQYDKGRLLERAAWTLRANLALLWHARRELRACDEIRFTGSPPYLIHFVMPLALLLGKRTRYRITDFHPECLIATRPSAGPALGLLRALTYAWRRRVDVIEVLGHDQAERLAEGGIDPGRLELRRDPSPVAFEGVHPDPAIVPTPLQGRLVVLYSGNWGVAHDTATFVEGLARAEQRCPGRVGLWLNATGAAAREVAGALQARQLAVVHTPPAPLAQLPRILRSADVHLITLRDAFVGYVMPSKVYACIDSGRPVLFIGSAASDVHRLCAERLPAEDYRRVDVGDADGVARALDHFLTRPDAERRWAPSEPET